MTYQHIQIPDYGSGVDISAVMPEVVDAALEKAYGVQKRIAWMVGAEKI